MTIFANANVFELHYYRIERPLVETIESCLS